MDYIIVENNSKAQIRKLINNNRHNRFYFVFNILKSQVSVQKQLFYSNLAHDVMYIIDMFGKIYNRRAMVFEVSFDHAVYPEGVFRIGYTLKTSTYESYQLIHFVNPEDKKNNFYLLQILAGNQEAINFRRDRNEFKDSTVIYRETIKEGTNNLVVVHNDKLGFTKAEKVGTLCEKCHYYDEDNYYVKCAVLPHVNHELIYQCREYQCLSVDDVVDRFLQIN